MKICCFLLRVWPLLLAALVVFFTPQARAQFTFASDQASNYGGAGEPGWTNGANAGTGFAEWSFTLSSGSGGFAGVVIEDPSSAGITGMSSESFGLFANPAGSGAYVFTDRSLSSVMQAGDTFSFQWGINWDGENGLNGNKGFTLYTGAPGSGQVINVNNGGNADIQFNGVDTGFGFGVNVMTWSFTMLDATTLSVSANDRDGAGTFSTNITVSGGLSSLRLYATNLASGIQRQPYYNDFLLTNSGLYNVAAAQTESRFLTGSGNLAKTGNGTLTISGTTNNFTGTVGITNGAIRVTAGSALGSSSGVTVQSGAALEYSGGITVNRNTTINGTGISAGGALRNISGNNTHSANLTLGSASRIASDADTLTISGAVSGSNVGLTVGGAGNTVMQAAIGIGTGRLTKENAGTLTLTANNTFTGNTLISGGALRLGNGGTTGAVTGNITNNGALIYHRSDSLAQSGVISGTGAVFKQGAGKLTLSNANTYSGTTTVSDGTLLATTSGSLGTTAGGTTVEDGATLEISSGATIAENITITGSGVEGGGAIRSLGDGENTLSGTITLGGNARINADSPAGSVTPLVSFGTTDLTVDVEFGFTTVAFSQTGSSLSITNASDGQTLFGTFAVIEDWSAYKSFALQMAVTGVNPNIGYSLEFMDSDFGTLAVYSGNTAGISSSGGLSMLNWESPVVTLPNVGAIYFTWAGADTNFVATISNIVSVPLSNLAIQGAIQGGNNVLTLGAGGPTSQGVGGNVTVSGVISGAGNTASGTTTSVIKDGAGVLTFGGANTYTGDTRIEAGTLTVAPGGTLGNGSDIFIAGGASLRLMTNVTVGSFQGANTNASVFIGAAQRLTMNGTNKGTVTQNARITGDGGLTLAAAGNTVLRLTGDNDFTGSTIVSGGTLELAATGAGQSALRLSAQIQVASGATLLISASDQVRDNADITLSGGTIQRGAGVSEVFGRLTVSGSGFLDFGTGDIGTFRFGTYTPSSLLTVQNFLPGNVLTFGSNLTGSINDGGLFTFDSSFVSGWDSGSSTFTITAIPEPSTYAAAAGLIALMLWPARRRLLKDVKSVLGLRAPMRERLARARQ
jgi:fibronectin-binding autotransporter adhesin